MSDTSPQHYDELITKYLREAVENQSTDPEIVIEEFQNSMAPIESEIMQARKEKREVYGLTSNTMRLLESTIILNPEINKERKYFIMDCFKHFNEHQLKLVKNKLSNAKKNPNFSDLLPSLSEEYENQKLFNDEYDKSIQEKNLTPGLLELLIKYKKHKPELVEQYQNPKLLSEDSKQSIREKKLLELLAEESIRKKELRELLKYTEHNPELRELINSQYDFSMFKPMVQKWMNEDADEVHKRLYTDVTSTDESLPPPSRMNEVDGGGRKNQKKKRQYKKSKSNKKKINKLKKTKKTKKNKKTKKTKKNFRKYFSKS
jgi:hypothetical protein